MIALAEQSYNFKVMVNLKVETGSGKVGKNVGKRRVVQFLMPKNNQWQVLLINY